MNTNELDAAKDEAKAAFPGAATSEQEWTLESLGDLLQGSDSRRYGWQVICDAHNTALAAERQRADDSIIENVRLMNELAAERERCERGLCKGAALFADATREHDAALVKPLVEAIKILLESQGCLCGEEAEIPEEISAQFDINLDDAVKVHDALANVKERKF